MLYNQKEKYIFIHIPKTAGTSIQRSFVGKRDASTPGFNDHISTTDVIKKIGIKQFQSCFSFTLVRNPWARIHSLYNHITEKPRKKWDHVLRPYKKMGFNNWVINEYENFILKIYPQWCYKGSVQQQIDWISHNKKIQISYVGKFENLSSEFTYLKNKTNNDHCSLRHANRIEHLSYQEIYNQDAINKVKELCKDDIQQWNYTF